MSQFFVKLQNDMESRFIIIIIIIILYYAFTALCRALAAFSASWSYTHLVGPVGWSTSPSQVLLSGIRFHDPSVRANEDSSCVKTARPLWSVGTTFTSHIFGGDICHSCLAQLEQETSSGSYWSNLSSFDKSSERLSIDRAANSITDPTSCTET
jgi:hypothetical protein